MNYDVIFFFKVGKSYFHISVTSFTHTEVIVHYTSCGLQWGRALHCTLEVGNHTFLHGSCPGKGSEYSCCIHFTVLPRVICYSATLMHPNQLISSHQAVTASNSLCALTAMPSVCLFPSRRTSPFFVCLGARIWGFQIWGFQHHRVFFMPAPYEFCNNRSSIYEAHVACAGFHIQQIY